MTTMDKLLYATKEIWKQYTNLPFILGIQNGTLPEDKFRYYMIQDYLYLQEYAKVSAIGVAKAKSQQTSQFFSNSVNVILHNEMEIHRGYMQRLGITSQEIENTPIALDNLSYTSYMLRIAYQEGEAEILAAILSCAYSYQVIAQEIVKNNPKALQHSLYGEWVRGYSSEEYANSNNRLIHIFNALTETYTEHQTQYLIDIFVACSRYELAFWNFAWKLLQ